MVVVGVLVLFNSMSLLNNIIRVATVHTSPGVGAAVVCEIVTLYYKGFLGVGWGWWWWGCLFYSTACRC